MNTIFKELEEICHHRIFASGFIQTVLIATIACLTLVLILQSAIFLITITINILAEPATDIGLLQLTLIFSLFMAAGYWIISIMVK